MASLLSPQLMLRGISSVGLMLKKPADISNNVRLSRGPGQYFAMPMTQEKVGAAGKDKTNDDDTKSISPKHPLSIDTRYHATTAQEANEANAESQESSPLVIATNN